MSEVKPSLSLSLSPNPGPNHECPTKDILKELCTSFNELWTSRGILGPVWSIQWQSTKEGAIFQQGIDPIVFCSKLTMQYCDILARAMLPSIHTAQLLM